jgi:hypothetical protein
MRTASQPGLCILGSRKFLCITVGLYFVANASVAFSAIIS